MKLLITISLTYSLRPNHGLLTLVQEIQHCSRVEILVAKPSVGNAELWNSINSDTSCMQNLAV